MPPINSIANPWNTYHCSPSTLISTTPSSPNIEITAITNNLMETPTEILTYINNTPETLTEDTRITWQYTRIIIDALDLGFTEPCVIPLATTKGDLLFVYDNEECLPNSLITMWVNPPTPPPPHPLDWTEHLQNIAKDIQDHNDYKPTTHITLWHKPIKRNTTNNTKNQDSNKDNEQDSPSAY